MSTTHDDAAGGPFEDRLLAALTEFDRDRAAEPVRTAPAARSGRRVRVRWQAGAIGVVAALAVAGAVVASGVLDRPRFETFGGTVLPGDQLGMKGGGCAAGATVTLAMDGTEIGMATASEWGSFDFVQPLPADFALGEHHLTATCAAADGRALRQDATFTVAAVRPTIRPGVDVWGDFTPGGQILVKGGMVTPGSEVSILLDGSRLGTATAGEVGSFDTTLTLPDDVAAGRHVIEAIGTTADGGAYDQSFPIEVASR
jgi:hypothetical protein